jgi:ribonuclease HI
MGLLGGTLGMLVLGLLVEVMMVMQFFSSLFTRVNLMEALAIKVAIERGCLLRWRKIICESDSHIVVDMLNNQRLEDVSWQLASLARQILSLCSSLDFVSFRHIPCEWNRVADCLAKWASKNVGRWDINARDELPSEYYEIFDQMLLEDRSM